MAHRVGKGVLIFLCTGLVLLASSCSQRGGDRDGGLPDLVERDLDAVYASDTLRVITRHHPLTYYLYRGMRRGFDYELMQKFADEQGLFLQVVLPPTWSEMIPYLYAGKGDVIASNMTVTRERDSLVTFTVPYLDVEQVAVGTRENPPPRTIEELNGRHVMVRKGSSYEERLRELMAEGLEISIEYHDELGENADPVQLVARGQAPLTIVDNTIARLEQEFYPDLEIGASVSEPQQIAWAVRPNAPELAAQLNEFLERYDRSAFFNILKKRYFQNPDRFLKHRTAHIRLFQEGRLSRYDDHFKAAAASSGFDWRFLAAQSYHESRFYPDKVSWAGAVGLMQIMPSTAEAMGITNLHDPVQNIMGGARYMRQLYDMIGENLDSTHVGTEDHIKLTLAAYNAGPGHVFNARKLVRSWQGDPDEWREVAKAFSLLETPEYYKQDGYAFVRGRSVRKYVADVMHRFRIFKDMVPELETDPADSSSVRLTESLAMSD